MNNRKKDRFYALLTIVIFLAFMIGLYIWQYNLNYIFTSGDTFFHVNRIYEIRQAFLKHQIPNWLNFSTFFDAGYAIDGMYPDITLWPLVALTMHLSPVHQIICIRFLIEIFAFLVTYIALIKNNYAKFSSALIAGVYSLSGFLLYTFTIEMELGTSIILIFAFPIFFTIKKILMTKHFSLKLILQMGLLFAIIIWSHLLSVLVAAIIIAPLVIYQLFKKNWYPLVNFALAAVMMLLLGLPILIRYFIISKTGINPPYNQGILSSNSIMHLFTGATWGSDKDTFSIPVIIIFVLLVAAFNKSKKRILMPLLIVETYIAFLCTNLIPLGLLDNVPFINNFQYIPWRIALFLNIIPFILLLENFNYRYVNKVLIGFFVVSLSAALAGLSAIQSPYVKIPPQKTKPILVTDRTKKNVPLNATYYITSSGIGSEKIIRQLLPDYAPQAVGTQSINGKDNYLSLYASKILKDHILVNGKYHKKFTTTSIPNEGVIIKTNKLQKGEVQVPIFDYTSLHYEVFLNNQKVNYHMSKHGFIAINNPQDLTNCEIKVIHHNPHIYKVALLFSGIVLLVVLILLFFIK